MRLMPSIPTICFRSDRWLHTVRYMRIVVCRVDEFPPGERRIVQAGRRSIGVFRVGDRFYAINNYCPHQGGPLCLGRTKPWVSSSGPGEFVLAEDDALLACPWHGWEYDLATGQSFLGPGEAPGRTSPTRSRCTSRTPTSWSRPRPARQRSRAYAQPQEVRNDEHAAQGTERRSAHRLPGRRLGH